MNFKLLSVALLVTFSMNVANADAKAPSTYEDFREILTMDKIYTGVVTVEKDQTRFMCMHILFKSDDANKRLDYYYKAWGRFIPQTDPCDYTSTELDSISTNQCIVEVGDTKGTPQINLDNINQTQTDKLFGFRILDVPSLAAHSRCKVDPATGGPSREADILAMSRETRNVNGADHDVLVVRLKLYINPPPWDVLNYVIILD